MGFLDAIEREKQQRLQEELAQQQQVVQEEHEVLETPPIDWVVSARRHGEIFLEDGRPLTELLKTLNELGYPNYIREVSRLTNTLLSPIIYSRGGYGYPLALELLYNIDRQYHPTRDYTRDIIDARVKMAEQIRQSGLVHMPKDFAITDIDLAQKITDVREEIVKQIGQSGLDFTYREPIIRFFDDNSGEKEEGPQAFDLKHTITSRIVNMRGESMVPAIVSGRVAEPRKKLPLMDRLARIFASEEVVDYSRDSVTNWFTEPQEVGVGFRFTKLLKSNQLRHRSDTSSAGDWCYYNESVTNETWLSAVYVRIQATNRAKITGHIQREADISDLKSFDDLLEEVMRQPTVAYIKDYEWRAHRDYVRPGMG